MCELCTDESTKSVFCTTESGLASAAVKTLTALVIGVYVELERHTEDKGICQRCQFILVESCDGSAGVFASCSC